MVDLERLLSFIFLELFSFMIFSLYYSLIISFSLPSFVFSHVWDPRWKWPLVSAPEKNYFAYVSIYVLDTLDFFPTIVQKKVYV